jgi:hypothetical protein
MNLKISSIDHASLDGGFNGRCSREMLLSGVDIYFREKNSKMSCKIEYRKVPEAAPIHQACTNKLLMVPRIKIENFE